MSHLVLILGGTWMRIEYVNEKYEQINLNLEDLKSNVVMFTHGSMLDAPATLAAVPLPAIGLAKKEIYLTPFLGWVALAFGGMIVDRENREKAIGVFNSAVRRCEETKRVILISPEGTRSKTGNLVPFKKGAFHLQQQINKPVIPCIIFGAFEL